MKALLLSLLAFFAISAQAQTVYPLGAGACLATDGGRSVTCTVPDGAQFDSFTYNILTGAAVFSRAGVVYTGAYTQGPATVYTATLHENPFTVTLFPTAEVVGTKLMQRSGSGRGGYQWHTFYRFDSLTVY